jgi:hypothetical protein
MKNNKTHLMRIIFFLYVAFQAHTQALWSNFSSVDPGFTVDIPGQVQRKDRIVTTDLGEFNITTFYSVSSVDSSENTLYLINFFEINYAVFEGDSAVSKEEFLSAMIDNIREDLNTKEIYRNSFPDSEVPSIIYRFENEQNASAVKGKVMIKGKYLFSLQVFTLKQFALNKNMDRFINSFYLK